VGVNLGPTDDRETNIQWHHDEDIAHVYTCDERMITRLRKNPVAKLVQVHKDQGGAITGLEFDVPVWTVSIRTTRRTPTLTEAQRESARRRLADLKTSRRGKTGHPVAGGE
jgi:hypothetical protein